MAIYPAKRVGADFFKSEKQARQARQPWQPRQQEQRREEKITEKIAEKISETGNKKIVRGGIVSPIVEGVGNVKIACNMMKILSPAIASDPSAIPDIADNAERIIDLTMKKINASEQEAARYLPTLLPSVMGMLVATKNPLDSKNIDLISSGLAYACHKIPYEARLNDYVSSAIDEVELRRSAMASIVPVIREMGAFRFGPSDRDDLDFAVKSIVASVVANLPKMAPDGAGELSIVVLAQSMMNNFGHIMGTVWKKTVFEALDEADRFMNNGVKDVDEAMSQARKSRNWRKQIKEEFFKLSEYLVSATCEIIRNPNIKKDDKPTRKIRHSPVFKKKL